VTPITSRASCDANNYKEKEEDNDKENNNYNEKEKDNDNGKDRTQRRVTLETFDQSDKDNLEIITKEWHMKQIPTQCQSTINQ